LLNAERNCLGQSQDSLPADSLECLATAAT